jgi:hypothetical protein
MTEFDQDPLYQLVLERLNRFEQTFEARFTIVELNVKHLQELNVQTADTLKSDQISLHDTIKDHELRLRTLTDSAVTFRTWQNLFSGGSIAASLTALLHAYLGH